MKRIIGIDPAYIDTLIDLPDTHRQHWLDQLDSHAKPELLLADLFGKHPGPCMPGGAICNMLGDVAALGGRTAFFGLVGQDAAGKLAQENFAARNIDLLLAPHQRYQSPIMYAVKRDLHETYYEPVNGHSCDFTPAHFNGAFDPADSILAIQMRQLMDYMPAVQSRLWQLQAEGAKIALGLQQIQYKRGLDSRFAQRMMKQADYIFGNREEYAFALESGNPRSALRDFSKQTAVKFVMTDGANGLYGRHKGRWSRIPANLPPEKIVCTIGAGDAVMAGTLYGLADNWNFTKATRLGAKLAEEILQTEGGQPQRQAHGHLSHLAQRFG